MKKRIVPKTTLILLLFTLLLAWSAVLPGRADSLIKSKEFTTRTFYADGDDDEVEFTENFGFAGDSYLNSGRFRMDIPSRLFTTASGSLPMANGRIWLRNRQS
ncbi:MAG: hypothetical protein ACLR2E_09090 [Lachnospiraceae bacterium]